MGINLLANERDLYEAMWGLDAYASHSPGATYLPLFLEMAHPSTRDVVLDAGCGSGKGALALQAAGFDQVILCDLTEAGLVPDARALPFYRACLWEDLHRQIGYLFGGRADWVYCCDVLEHIPTPFTMLAVSRLLDVARRGLFLSISLMPDSFGAFVGRPLHHTVQTFAQWTEQLSSLATVIEARDLLHSAVFLLRPPC